MTLWINNTTDIVYNWVPLDVTIKIAPLVIAIIIVIIVIVSYKTRGGTMK